MVIQYISKLNKTCLKALFVIVALVSAFSTIYGQENKRSFDHKSLDSILIELSHTSQFSFNYDPIILSGYTYSGEISKELGETDLKRLLYHTPLDFLIRGNTVVIFLEEPTLYEICGYIKDGQSGEPLPYANIYLDSLNIGTQTDEEGFFDLELTSTKDEKVTISYVGFEPKGMIVQDIIGPNCSSIDLVMDLSSWTNDIVITDYAIKGITEGASFNGYSLNYSQLSKSYSTVEHDLLKTTQLLPGIISIDESATHLTIRGSSEGQNLILWEGAPLYQSGHLFGMISAINPFVIDKMEVYKGVYHPIYDNRVGGVIDISLSDEIIDAPTVSIGTTLTEAHINSEVPIVDDHLGIVVSARHSTNPILQTPPTSNYINRVLQLSIVDDQAQDVREGLIDGAQDIGFYDLKAKVLFEPSDKVFFKAGILRNAQEFQYQYSLFDGAFRSTDHIEEKTGAVHIDLNWKATPIWQSTLSYTRSEYNNTYNFDQDEQDVILTDYSEFNEIRDRTLTYSNQIKLGNRSSLSSGYSFNKKEVSFSSGGQYLDQPEVNFQNTSFGTFHNLFFATHHQTDRMTLDGGFRTTYVQELQRWFWAPRMSAQIGVSESIKLKAEAGIFHQFISQINQFGNNLIQVETPLWVLDTEADGFSLQSRKAVVGAVYTDHDWLIDGELYYNNTTGLNTVSSEFDPSIFLSELNSGSSEAVGFDVLVKKKWSAYNLLVNYSLARTTYFFEDQSDASFAAPTDIRHIGNIMATYQYKDLKFSLSSRMHSGLPFTEPAGLVGNPDDNGDIEFYSLAYESINSRRLSPYLRIDAGVHYRSPYKEGHKWRTEISLSMINVLGRQNVFAREHYVDNETNSSIPLIASVDKTLLGRTPLLLLRVYY